MTDSREKISKSHFEMFKEFKCYTIIVVKRTDIIIVDIFDTIK